MSKNSPSPPLVPIPMEDLYKLYAQRNNKQKKTPSDSPLALIPLEENIRRIKETMARIEKAKLKVKSNEKKPRTTTFKIPKRMSGICFKRATNVGTKSLPTSHLNIEQSKKPKAIPPKMISQVRKVLFTSESSPDVKASTSTADKHRITQGTESGIKLIKQKAKAVNPKSTMEQQTVDKFIKPVPIRNTKPRALKLASLPNDQFEFDEVLCKSQSPSNITINLADYYYLQDLFKKQEAISIEINTAWQKILSQNIKSSVNSKSNSNCKVRLNSTAVSGKQNNLLKSTLMKTIEEKPSSGLNENVEDKSGDEIEGKLAKCKLARSISMYNSMRGHFLETPKKSMQELEHGDSLSTTVQKQCLSLMDTPKL